MTQGPEPPSPGAGGQPGSPGGGAAAEAASTRINRLFKNTGVYAVGDIAIKLTTAFLAPLYTALLLPEEYGVWSMGVMVLTGLNHLYNPALHGAVNRFYYEHEHDAARRRRFDGTISTFLILWSILLSGALLASGPWLFERLFNALPYEPYGALITWTALLNVLSVVPKATWTAAERSKAFVGINMLASAVNIFGALALVALMDEGVLGLFEAKLLSTLIVAWPFARYLWREVGFAFHGADLWAAMRFSLPLVPHLLAHWALSMADRIVIEALLGIGAVGIYGSAYIFTEAVSMVANSMNRAWVPLFSRAYDDVAEHPLIARTITYFMLAVSGTSGALAVLSPTLVRTLYADKYAAAAEVAAILSLGGFFLGLYLVYVSGLFFYKKNNTIPIITLVAGAINVGLNILWIPHMGIAGAAWATLVAYAVLALGVRWACRRVTRLPFERDRMLKLAVAVTPSVALGMAIDGLWSWPVELPAKLALLARAPLILALWGFWTPEEMSWARARVRSALRRPPRP